MSLRVLARWFLDVSFQVVFFQKTDFISEDRARPGASILAGPGVPFWHLGGTLECRCHLPGLVPPSILAAWVQFWHLGGTLESHGSSRKETLASRLGFFLKYVFSI